MKTIFDKDTYQNLRARLESLTPESPRQWGKMTADQMLAHCNIPIEQAIGKVEGINRSNLLSRTLIRWVVLRDKPFGKNLPTVPDFVIADARDFAREKARLLQNLDDFYNKGENGNWSMHPAFGKMTPAQWSWLTYKHLDHHLSQFSA